MAKKTTAYPVYEWRQEEIIETKQVADPDTGVVEDVTTVVQGAIDLTVFIEIIQETFPDENKSIISGSVKATVEMGENTNSFTLYNYDIAGTDYSYQTYYWLKKNGFAAGTKKYTFTTNEKKTVVLHEGEDFLTYHSVDGILHKRTVFNETTISYIADTFNSQVRLKITGKDKRNDGSTVTCLQDNNTIAIDYSGDLLSIDRAINPITADNFTDEDNPSFSYSAPTAGKSVLYRIDTSGNIKGIAADDVFSSLQAALSFDGETIDIDYRDIPIEGGSYTFNLSDVERELLRQKAQGSDTVPIYYMTKITRSIDTRYSSTLYDMEADPAELISKTERNFTVVGCNPTLNPTVKDIKEETIALTGDENTFIRYESMAEFAFNATASKHATIVSQSVQCGSKTISNLPNGVIDNVESGTFIFNVTDSRNMGASSSVFKNLVEYVKPTCYQKLEIAISGETGANINLTINGNYYNGSFGAVDNTLLLEVRYTNDDGNMGEWQTIPGTPTFNGNTYKLQATFGGFNYGKAYIFQCRATDKLNVVQSAQYTIRLLPVFDWSEEDFNFNVPVQMNGKTVLRHNREGNNTVLSASGGHIYIRPGGTDNTSGETIIYPDGRIQFGGEVTFADGTTGGGSSTPTDLADYVIETGEEAMGSNGTWYWRKWASGKAECWGCRNFGNMAVTTAWGSLYRSAIFTQDLPEDVFARTPDSININIVHGGYGGWICKHEQTAPSAITTGSFIYVRPASATVTPSNLGFHIIGEWK